MINMKENLIRKKKGKVMKNNKIVTTLLVSLVSVTLFGCGNNKNKDKNKNNNNNDIILDIKEIENDLELDENGKFNIDYLEEPVEINMWNVIGEPDLYTLTKLIDEFNDEYDGYIKINMQPLSEETYYTSLETKFVHDFQNFPDVCLMHNEVNIEYAVRGYFYPLDELIEKSGVDFSYENAYDNIERTTVLDGKHLFFQYCHMRFHN